MHPWQNRWYERICALHFIPISDSLFSSTTLSSPADNQGHRPKEGKEVEFLLKTPEAAKQLKVAYSHLISLLRHGKINPPQKDSSGDYVWTEADLAAARQALSRRQAKGGRVKN
jgi:hypothetical protein